MKDHVANPVPVGATTRIELQLLVDQKVDANSMDHLGSLARKRAQRTARVVLAQKRKTLMDRSVYLDIEVCGSIKQVSIL